jgi:selenocysteine lyase/cysteine desulfurase
VTEAFDIKRAREETSACDQIIHFNNAGSSLMPRPVSEVLHAYLHKEERYGGYETAASENDAIENFYEAVAKLLNCEKYEIAYVENATRAWGMAFYSFQFQAGDRILTTISEYSSNVIAYNQQADRYRVEVVFVPNDEYGQIDVKELENMIDERVKLISISHIPTGGGLVNPAREVGRIAKAAAIPFLLDSCQGVGQLPLDVNEIGCDILCGTGRKYLRGPRGTGLLYVRREMIEKLEPPMLDLHAATLLTPTSFEIRPDARRFENWEQYFAGKTALGRAIDYACSWGLEAIRDRIYSLAAILRERLASIDGVTITDEGLEKCGIVTFMADRMNATAIKKALADQRINVSTSSSSGSLVSYQMRGLKEVVRASLHYYNTIEEVEYFVTVLQKILNALPITFYNPDRATS